MKCFRLPLLSSNSRRVATHPPFRCLHTAIMHRAPKAMITRPEAANVSINSPRDPNTLSNYNNWKTTHTSVDFRINFERKTLSGEVKLNLQSITDAETREIVLDTSYVDVKDVKVDGQPQQWRLAPRFEPYGSPLSIKLPAGVRKGDGVQVEITSSTTEKCTALQWLTPAQTSNRKHPYMFSQCQAIHARSVFPCQDTPDVKSTVSFKLQSPLQVLASGLPERTEKVANGSENVYFFEQTVPIPSYLFAVASGDIVGAQIGPRSMVWTGPPELSDCKWEMEEDTEKFIQAAEKIIYPYAWGTYNGLVLPPSFPYGGMENPIYTFFTPTMISGDRQNVDTIAHELSHSWSGNLVSTASWEHFWLNEGWTTYLERRIQAALHGGEPARGFSATIGWKALQDSIKQFGEDSEFTKLVPNLKGKDPDDAFSSIPYEKGFVFLFYLEKLLGQENWDRFIPHYFTAWKFKSLDSYDFKATLLDFFDEDSDASAKLAKVDWDAWFYKPGFPPKPDYDDSRAKVCYELADKWEALSDSSTHKFQPHPSDIKGWTSSQLIVFLERVQLFDKPVKSADAHAMGTAYGLLDSKNVELTARYYGVGLKAGDKEIVPRTVELLGKVGRMKFVRPLYRELKKVDAKLAMETFEKNKDFYHPICRDMVDKDLHKSNE